MPNIVSIPAAAQFVPTRFSFAQAAVIANQSNVALKIVATDAASGAINLTDYILPFAGSLYAIGYRISATITAGNLTLTPTLNGTASTAAGLILSAVNDTYRFAQIDAQTQGARFAAPTAKNAPNRLGCLLSTSAAFAPTTSDLWVDLYVLFDDVRL
jgi:hypothetical protein